MLLREVVEEITEKLPNDTYLSPASIVRKVSQLRDRLLRNYTSAQQQSGALTVTIDMVKGKSHYIPPCPPKNITDVDVLMSGYNGVDDWRRIPLRQFDEYSKTPYYYFLSGKMGIYPAPYNDVPGGIKIFFTPVLPTLTINDMDNSTGFDPDFDMVLVYGVLKDIVTQPLLDQYLAKYNELLREYISANSGYERYVVKERW